MDEMVMAKTPRPANLPYLISISEWWAPYSFGINRLDDEGDPFREYKTIELQGALIVPTVPKTAEVTVIVWFEDYLDPEPRRKARPEYVGHMENWRGTLKCNLYAPLGMYQPLIGLLAAGKLKFLNWDGDKLRYGRGQIRSYTWDYGAPDDHIDELKGIWRTHTKKSP